MRRLRAAAAGIAAATLLGVAPYAAGASSDAAADGEAPAGVHQPAAGPGGSTACAQSVNAQLSSQRGRTRPFVVDTSRDGNGPLGSAWCNPPGRALGSPPREGGVSGAGLLLWIKVPGDSDGECGTPPDVPAGQFSPGIAMRLIEGT